MTDRFERPSLPGIIVALCLACAGLVACSNRYTPSAQPATASARTSATVATVAPLPSATTEPSPTPVPPTPTPEPPAVARVNGQPITVEAFQREVLRYEAAQQALGRDPAVAGTGYLAQVLDALIEQLLIEQSAEAEGVAVSDPQVDAEMQRLVEATGGQEGFDQWLESNQYTETEFRQVLRTQMIVLAMNERVTADVGATAEQVHARHIVVDTAEIGDLVLSQLQQGTDFATLAAEYSLDESTRLLGGDLGFFPRNILLSPEVEEVAFSLQVGETSGLIQSAFGYHVVQVLAKEPNRPVPQEVQQRLREVAFQQWVKSLWDAASVERNM